VRSKKVDRSPRRNCCSARMDCVASSPTRIAAILHDDPVKESPIGWVESALSRGARDNVSVVVVGCQA